MPSEPASPCSTLADNGQSNKSIQTWLLPWQPAPTSGWHLACLFLPRTNWYLIVLATHCLICLFSDVRHSAMQQVQKITWKDAYGWLLKSACNGTCDCLFFPVAIYLSEIDSQMRKCGWDGFWQWELIVSLLFANCCHLMWVTIIVFHGWLLQMLWKNYVHWSLIKPL